MTSQRNFYMRHALEVILRSDAITYIRPDDLKRIQNAFVLPTPGENSYSLWFDIEPFDENSSRWVRGIININLQWSPLTSNQIDGDGSMWSTYKFSMHMTVREHHQITGSFLDKWLDCSSVVSRMLADIRSLNIPDEIREMTHTNEQRIIYEKQKAKESAEKNIAEFLMTAQGSIYRKNLRSGGKPKKIPTATVAPLLGGSSEPTYNIVVKEPGYSWNARWRHYTLHFFKDSLYSLILKLK